MESTPIISQPLIEKWSRNALHASALLYQQHTEMLYLHMKVDAI